MPIDLTRLLSLRDTVAAHDLRAVKGLGQHFLFDTALLARIVDAAGDLAGCTVVEVGPGPGGLTRALLSSHAVQIVAIETDRRCVAALAALREAAGDRLTLIEGDALKLDARQQAPAPRAVVANLPYNVGTELLLRWIQTMPDWRSLTVMLQAEVVDRIVAAPGSKTYGRLSVIAQFCCDVARMLEVPAAAFTPPPKVASAVVRLTPRHDRPADIALGTLERLTAAAFGQRRKMLRSSLKSLGGEDLLRRAGIDSERRAETLTLHEFEALARVCAP